MDLVRRHPHAAALCAYGVMAVAATWPLAARFGTDLAGGGGWDALWSLWWWADSVTRRASPFFCDVLRWPSGVSLWPRAGNVPAATALVPLWLATPRLPEVALYNAVVFASYPLAGFTAYLLCRELWGGHLAAFLAGALYTFSAYHLGAAGGPLDALSIEWIPLYFLALVRTVRRHGPGPPLLGGAALALAAATSPHQLASCAVGTAVLVVAWWRVERGTLTSPAFLRRVLLLAVTFLVLAGWLYGAVAARLAPGSVPDRAGASVDLLSFVVPARLARWGTGAGLAEGVAYVGYVALALAGLAASRAKASRPWLAVAAVGFVLALGARLQVAGAPRTPAMLPFAWIGLAVPAVASAAAARFTTLVVLGVAVAAGGALAHLVRNHRRGAALAAGITVLALVESWPGAVPTARWPAPRFLRDLAKDGERWAVLDATAPERQLWHQVLHRHPQLGPASPPSTKEAVATGSAVVDALVARRGVTEVASSSAAHRQGAVRVLQQMNVRFVIADADTLGAARALRLPPAYSGEGIVVFEVPPRTG